MIKGLLVSLVSSASPHPPPPSGKKRAQYTACCRLLIITIATTWGTECHVCYYRIIGWSECMYTGGYYYECYKAQIMCSVPLNAHIAGNMHSLLIKEDVPI